VDKIVSTCCAQRRTILIKARNRLASQLVKHFAKNGEGVPNFV
jgi:hypothetical protein